MDEFFPIIDENINPCRGCPDYDEDGCKSNGGCGKHTNADRIRNMSMEEMAEWLENIDTAYEPETVVSQHGWLCWLRQEAQDG